MKEWTLGQKMALTVYIVLLLAVLMIGIIASTYPRTCEELNYKLTAYEWYMKQHTLDYNEWLEFVSLSYEWSDKNCERKTSEGAEESPRTGHNKRTSSLGEWTVLPRRKVILSSEESPGQEPVQASETEVG